MNKSEFDTFYTPPELAKRLIDATRYLLASRGYEITDVIEPSAGNGAFSSQIECTAYDILPQAIDIIQADFLNQPIEYKKGRLCIGNPPFGKNNWQSIRFYKKCCQIGDYIAFIQPINQLNNSLMMYEFDLVYSEDLGIVDYSSTSLHCCFNIYVRPKSGILNPKPDYRLKDVTLIEYRRGRKKERVKAGYDMGVCVWGDIGKIPAYVGECACEVYIYVRKKEYLPAIKRLMERDRLVAYFKGISATRISISKLYKYLKDNIEGIE